MVGNTIRKGVKMELQAVWGMDYDFREDKCYKRPSCPECAEPIGQTGDDDSYYCYSCGKKVEVTDKEMQEWFRVRRETKVEISDCFPVMMKGCGGKKCVKAHYIRNPITLNWQLMGGRCEKCGMEFLI